MVSALCYGSLNPDIVHEVGTYPGLGDDIQSRRWTLWPGGAAANTAVPLAAWGARTAVIGNTVGDDPLGRWMLDDLARRSIDVTMVRLDPGSTTPHCVILLTPDGERTIVATGYQSVHWQEVPEEAWRSRSVAVVDAYSGAAGEAAMVQARQRDIPVVGLDVTGRAAASASVVVWSSHEHDLHDAVALSGAGPDVVMTAASEPATWYRSGEILASAQPPAAQVVDATGAGDTLAAMIAFGTASSWEPETTLRMAVAAASLIVEQPRRTDIPDLGAVKQKSGCHTVR